MNVQTFSTNSQEHTAQYQPIGCILRDRIIDHDGRQATDESPRHYWNSGRWPLVLPHRVHCPDLPPVQLHAPSSLDPGVQTPVLWAHPHPHVEPTLALFLQTLPSPRLEKLRNQSKPCPDPCVLKQLQRNLSCTSTTSFFFDDLFCCLPWTRTRFWIVHSWERCANNWFDISHIVLLFVALVVFYGEKKKLKRISAQQGTRHFFLNSQI